MRRKIDRHDWFADFGDLISDCIPKPTLEVPFPRIDRAKWEETTAFYRLAHNKEDNDCGVRALAVACAAPYDKAHRALQELGRIAGQACVVSQMIGAAVHLKRRMVRVEHKAKTLRTVERELADTSGGFILTTADHAVGIWNGELIDHARGSLMRVGAVYRIEPTRSTAP